MYIRQLMHLGVFMLPIFPWPFFCVTEDMAMEGRMGSAGERNGITTQLFLACWNWKINLHLCTTYLDHRTKKPHYGKTDMPENGVLETVDA